MRFLHTAFTSYGAFWLSFATLLIPSSGIADAYAASKHPAQEVDAIAIYLTAWMVVTFLFLLVPSSFSSCSRTHPLVFLFHSIGSLRKSIGLTALFFLLTLTFMLLAVCECGLFISQSMQLTVSMCDSRLPEERNHWQGWWRCWHCDCSCRLLLRSWRATDRGRCFHHPTRQIPPQVGLKSKVYASCPVIRLDSGYSVSTSFYFPTLVFLFILFRCSVMSCSPYCVVANSRNANTVSPLMVYIPFIGCAGLVVDDFIAKTVK
jgi:GPR1/FUN34/yaaH family